MKTHRVFLFSLCVGLASVAFANSARADGVVVRGTHLSNKDRGALKTEVQKLRVKNPQIFVRVADAPKIAVEVDEARRGRISSISLPLSAMGKEALFPMLEMLALDAPPRGQMSDSAWTTMRVGLIEAVGMIRDPRAKPVLNAILDRSTEFEILRAAAEALGRIGDDASTKKLVRLALTPSDKQAPVVAALGECRRIAAANALAKLANTKDEAQAQIVLKSLGAVGNAWAWQTPDVAKTGEGDKVRAIAARALMQPFVNYTGYTRHRAQTGLLMVNDPSTPALIAGARKGASPALVSALDELSDRLSNNPVR